MNLPTRILLNATARHGGTERTLPISIEFLSDGTPVTTTGAPRTDTFPLAGLDALTQSAATPALPPFPIAALQAAQQEGNLSLMQQLQSEYTIAVQTQQASQATVQPRTVVANALAQWLADTQQVYTTPGDHYVLDFATLQCTEFDRGSERVMAFSPAAVFG